MKENNEKERGEAFKDKANKWLDEIECKVFIDIHGEQPVITEHETGTGFTVETIDQANWAMKIIVEADKVLEKEKTEIAAEKAKIAAAEEKAIIRHTRATSFLREKLRIWAEPQFSKHKKTISLIKGDITAKTWQAKYNIVNDNLYKHEMISILEDPLAPDKLREDIGKLVKAIPTVEYKAYKDDVKKLTKAEMEALSKRVNDYMINKETEAMQGDQCRVFEQRHQLVLPGVALIPEHTDIKVAGK